MPRTIWKYEIEVTDQQVLRVPLGAHFLPFVEQQPGQPHNMLSIWAIVHPHEANDRVEDVTIHVVGTGNPLHQGVHFNGYIGSIQSGVLVWHVFRDNWR